MIGERYEIIKLLGKGRTGGVYEAEDTRLGRKVAMRRFFAQTEFTDISEYEEEFLNISQSLSALQHPNLLRVFDAGLDEDGAFMISQLMKGGSLHKRLKEGPLPVWDVWDLSHQMLDALSAAHAAGFVHGAITPGSILMSPRARGGFLYVILDMGLCRLAPLIQGEDSILSMMADPAILAPELFDGSNATEKADLYMLGNILYMCLAGGHPFARKSLEECSELHRAGLPPLSELAPDAPSDFVEWINGLCAVDTQDRPDSVVTALKTMPKVSQPVATRGVATKVHVAQASTLGHSAASTLTSVSAVPVSHAGVASTIAQSYPTKSTLEIPKKSYKALYLTLGLLALVAVVLVMMMRKGDRRTGEQIAAEQARLAADESKFKSKVYPKEVVVSLNLRKRNSPSKSWRMRGRKHQKMVANGWSIQSGKNKKPTLAKCVTGREIKGMFDKGWTLKYVVQVSQGSHRFGLDVVGDGSAYWGDTGKSASFCLEVINTGGEIMLLNKASGQKVIRKKRKGEFLILELKGAPADKSGSFELYINGILAEGFQGKIQQQDDLKLYSSSAIFSIYSKGSQASSWILKEMSLFTGTE